MFFTDKLLRQCKSANSEEYTASAMNALENEIDCINTDWWHNRFNQLEQLKARMVSGKPGHIMRHGSVLRSTALALLQYSFVNKIKNKRIGTMQKEIFEYICANSWCVQGRIDGWKSDLWTADIGVYLSLTFELIQGELTSEEKRRYRKALFEKSFCPIYEEWISPEEHEHCLDTMGHNWWSVCVSAAGVVLSVQEETEITNYKKLFQETTHAINSWLSYKGNRFLNKRPNFGKDGDYIEYLGYLSYALDNLCVLQTMLENEDKKAILEIDAYLERLPDFILQNIVWDKGVCAGAEFGDSGLKNSMMAPLFYLCKRYHRGDLLGCLQRLRPCPATVQELCNYPYGLETSSIKLPNAAVYALSGQAVLRTGHKKEDLILIVKTGDSWNHNHLDAGTFELCCNGSKYISDSGKCSYLNPLYRGYYIKPEAHNIVTLNGEGEWERSNFEGTKFPGDFPALLSADDYQFLLADCTGPYAHIYQRFYRNFFRFEQYVLIIDDIQTYADGVLERRFHGNGKTMTQCGTHILIRNPAGEGRILFPFVADDDVSLEGGYLAALPEDEQGIEISPESDCAVCRTRTNDLRAKLFTLIDVSGNEDTVTMIADYSDDVYDITIQTQKKKHRFLVNCLADGRVMHRNAKIQYRDITTDGFITYLCSTLDDKLESFAVHNSSLLKYNDTCLFTSLIKENYYQKIAEKKN